jgi:DNA adenine methylase (dam)
MADPILKWAGGKRQILDKIRGEFPTQEINGYHEPFFGGGAVFFREMHEEAVTINDINERLMNFYRVVRDHPKKLIDELNDFDWPESNPDPSLDHHEVDQHGREIKNYYYQQRARFNKRPNGEEVHPVREAALLLYLNVTCYNGLYRENQSGEFNVPIGSHMKKSWDRFGRIREASKLLSGVDILSEDFGYVVDRAEPGELVYFDPPYDPNSDSSTFSSYSCEAFGKAEQLRLKDVAKELDRQDVYVVISNAPSIEDAYLSDNEFEAFETRGVGARRAINSNGTERGEVNEILISNVDNVRERDTTLSEFS